jgi:hypothetical protein
VPTLCGGPRPKGSVTVALQAQLPSGAPARAWGGRPPPCLAAKRPARPTHKRAPHTNARTHKRAPHTNAPKHNHKRTHTQTRPHTNAPTHKRAHANTPAQTRPAEPIHCGEGWGRVGAPRRARTAAGGEGAAAGGERLLLEVADDDEGGA